MFRFCDFTYSGLIDILVQALVAILWDFFNTLTMFLPIVRVWMGSILGIYILKFKVIVVVVALSFLKYLGDFRQNLTYLIRNVQNPDDKFTEFGNPDDKLTEII